MKRSTARLAKLMGIGSVLLTALPSSCQMQLNNALVDAVQASLIGLAGVILDPCNLPELMDTADCFEF